MSGCRIRRPDFSTLRLVSGAVAGLPDQHRHFQIGLIGDRECNLFETEKALARMVEGPFAAFAAQDAVLIPELRELFAVPPQRGNEFAKFRIIQMRA